MTYAFSLTAREALAVLVLAWVLIAGFLTWAIVHAGSVRARNSRRHAEQRQAEPIGEGSRGGIHIRHTGVCK